MITSATSEDGRPRAGTRPFAFVITPLAAAALRAWPSQAMQRPLPSLEASEHCSADSKSISDSVSLSCRCQLCHHQPLACCQLGSRSPDGLNCSVLTCCACGRVSLSHAVSNIVGTGACARPPASGSCCWLWARCDPRPPSQMPRAPPERPAHQSPSAEPRRSSLPGAAAWWGRRR